MLLSELDIRAEIDSGRAGFDAYEPELIQPSGLDVRGDRTSASSSTVATRTSTPRWNNWTRPGWPKPDHARGT